MKCLKGREKDAKRFQKYVLITKDSECWIWTGYRDKDGYGGSCLDGKGQRANRVSYQIYKGGTPKDLFVLYKCDNPTCVNPDHLFLGTVFENIEDMVNKGRQAKGNKHGSVTHPEKVPRMIGDRNGSRTKPEMLPRGSKHPFAKVNEYKIKEMRRMYKNGAKQSTICTKYGLSPSVVCNIVNGKTWTHVF